MVSENVIINWAEERGLLDEGLNPIRQASKMLEEAVETLKAVGDYQYSDEPTEEQLAEVCDGIGDVWVTLVILANMHGTTLANCTHHAWQEIKDRRGRTEGGMFIKEVE